jgi:hypothetical protein
MGVNPNDGPMLRLNGACWIEEVCIYEGRGPGSDSASFGAFKEAAAGLKLLMNLIAS